MFSHLFGASPVDANISKNGEDATTELPEAIQITSLKEDFRLFHGRGAKARRQCGRS
jgi:hypothetical protein